MFIKLIEKHFVNNITGKISKWPDGDLLMIHDSKKSLSLVITILFSIFAEVRISESMVSSLFGKSSVCFTSNPFSLSNIAKR